MARLRLATAADAATIARIYVETWRDAYPGMLPDSVLVRLSPDRQSRSWRHAVGDPGQAVLVADEPAAGVVGFGSCGASRRRILPFSGEVYTLYVSGDHQRRGVGRQLIFSLLAALRERGHDSALVWALADNPSRFFYEAMGGALVAEGDEVLWGVSVRQRAYGWRNLERWLSSRR